MILPARLLSKLSTTDPEKCWEWTRATTKGYGRYWHNGRMKLAYGVVYEMLVGPVPDGLVLDHRCTNTLCCNPSHLEPVTHEENVRRGAALITHCPKGHPYSGDNLIVRTRKTGTSRECRTCKRAMDKRYREGMAL